MQHADTQHRPFGTVRAAVAKMLRAYGVRLLPPPAKWRLQTQHDELCQTWCAAFAVAAATEIARSRGDDEQPWTRAARDNALRNIEARGGCDRLCAVLRFSETVYERVPFSESTRRGLITRTLASQGSSVTPRRFAAPVMRRC